MENAYQIRVQLEGVTKPPVWREMVVPANINLYLLHCCIQGAMGHTSPLQIPKLSTLKLLKSLHQLCPSIHHKRPVGSNGFTNWFTA